MISIKGNIDKNRMVANLIEHANKDKSIASGKIFKAVVLASIISTFSNPIFAESVKDANLNELTKFATSKVQGKEATLPSTLFKKSGPLTQVKVMSFNGKNTSSKNGVSISLLDSRLPSPDLSDMMANDYLGAIDKMNDDELIGNYKTWLAIKISLSNLVLSAKDGFPSSTEKTTVAGIESLEARLKYVNKLIKSGDSEEISSLRNTIKKEGVGMIPGSNELEMYRSGFAYAISLQGACSVIYNKDFLSSNSAKELFKRDGTPIYSSNNDLFESFIINHEFSHCETQGSKFIKNQTDLAAEELRRIKTSGAYSSINKEQLLLLSLFSVSYNEYISEFYADVLGLSRTIRENNLTNTEASMLVNDVIGTRYAVGVKGDLTHATGHLLEKTKRYYERMGMPFGYDLGDHDSDERMSKMMSSFSKLPFNDAIKSFTIIAAAKSIGELNLKDLTLTPRQGVKVDNKPLSKLLYISPYDISNYSNGLRSALNKFSTPNEHEKVDLVIKQYEKDLTSSLAQDKKSMSLDY